MPHQMKATEVPVTKFLQGTQQFLIPIYQRTYNWTEKQCDQLWDDITSDAPSHFIGSIVYIEEGLYQVSDVPQLLVIDGQQRLTTLVLLFAALAEAVEKKDSNEVTSKKIQNYFLFNSEEEGERRYKLILTQSDRDTLRAIIEGRPMPENSSKNIINNFEYFQNCIAKSDIGIDAIYRGIGKLIMVDISLDANNDNPQLIFESLNSTGLSLSQTDLIRNYILMDLKRKEQDRIYADFWHPMEESFGDSQMFDDFIRDYLTIKTSQIPNIRDVYSSFKEYSPRQSVEDLVSDIRYHAGFYTRMIFESEQDMELNQIIRNVNALKNNVAYPFLLEVYTDYDKKVISRGDILEIFQMVESYVFRRAICDLPTKSLNKTFAGLADQIDKSRYVESLMAIFCLMDKYRRFPTDSEFTASFVRKDVYNTTRIRKHLLDRLENHDRKERVNIEEYTIEHIMPQNKDLSEKWREDLGPDWKEIHEKYLHTAGNLTLTGYNSELGDKSFLEKRDMKGGFASSPINLNNDLARLEKWDELEILGRGKALAQKSVEIWGYPHTPQEILEKNATLDEGDDESDDENLSRWESELEKASEHVRSNIDSLVSQIHQRFDCVEEPYSRWLKFSVKRPTEPKNTFALINCHQSTANVMFRIEPNTFQNNPNVRKVAGWFFPRGTERRMSITKDTMPDIMSFLEHSYDATLALIKTQHHL